MPSANADAGLLQSKLESLVDRLDQFVDPFRSLFKSGTRSVAGSAVSFLRGLFATERRNLQQISETIDGVEHQNLQYLLSAGEVGLLSSSTKISQTADSLLGGHDDSVLIIDESGFSKKASVPLA